ncbi:lipid IV(A) 3-deoxy-D-manno-octulosonic acid transferase [Schlegelella sp. S2-27]|uniref:3-deoxy-D-manno-octulosonic acid transferase n=1 Tax=Caldimonas mangrovi TaxID=2944811 RepID=A0ABT0YJ18_9BURK|nr:lipid IV(A) 3-deoxy-D-manno-octulosonic acid transferase [Caldimonas mangrovi]MCM5678227.1 lipid IV(A) 3-deoxy-D-manno-octulosonic acid transferase [Caldimonas mangrovi]
MRRGVARHAYSLLLSVLKPAYLFKLWWRGRDEPLYRHAVLERLGVYRHQRSEGWVWIHAVSLGETRAAASLVEALREQLPGMQLLLTHGTATGREAGRALLRPGDAQAWLPYDTPSVVRRFFAQFRPRAGVLMETEVWPNLLHAAHAASVPMVLANARLSEKSLRQAKRLEAVMRPAIDTLAMVLAQTPDDATRLREAGAINVEVCGNLKFDMTPAPQLLALGRSWRRAVSPRPVVLAASTREGEEEPLLAAWRARASPRPLLLLVPRHPQRFDEVAAMVRNAGLRAVRRSESKNPPAEEVDVWLGDSIGEMPAYYAAADVALLGGSFAPLGGQNLIEAAACGCPVVMGPHTFNFAEAAELSLGAEAAVRADDLAAAVPLACGLAASPEREAMSQRCLAFATAHRGAARAMAQRIAALAELTASTAN